MFSKTFLALVRVDQIGAGLVDHVILYNPVWVDSTFANQQLRRGANVIRFTLYLIKVIITLLTIRTVAVLCVGIPCVITKQNVTFPYVRQFGLTFSVLCSDLKGDIVVVLRTHQVRKSVDS